MPRKLAFRPLFVVILSSDLRDEADLFADLYGLCAAFGAELIEETARVGLDCILTDEKPVRYLAVAETLRDQLENFQLAPRDTEIFQALLVESEWLGHRDFSDDENFFLLRQLQSQPDPETGEECGDETAIDLYRVLDDEEAKLDHAQHDDQDPAAQTVDERVNNCLLLHRESIFSRKDAKAQRKTRSVSLLCAFASLRETSSPKKLVDTPACVPILLKT